VTDTVICHCWQINLRGLQCLPWSTAERSIRAALENRLNDKLQLPAPAKLMYWLDR